MSKYIDDCIALGLNEMSHEAHDNSKAHGWWDSPEWSLPEKLMLIVTEVAEAMEDYRNGKLEGWSEPNGKPCGLPSELADIIIRVGDLAGKMGINLGEAVVQKMKYNRSRPYRHGGKVA